MSRMVRASEWKPAGQRLKLATLQRAIERSLQWAVFEPSNEALWAKVRTCVEDLLMAEWKAGALRGSTPAEAFFVRCDQTTMTQYDIEHGQVILLAGVAPVKPSEFSTLRIVQSTAN
ncbi:MAG: phage tail sheath C-terminal domain-containing protein [Burkholderiales bacterium]